MLILRKAKKLAQQYRALSGKPLGITGEVAQYRAARLLDVELMQVRQAYDAIERRSGKRRYQQIKANTELHWFVSSGFHVPVTRDKLRIALLSRNSC